MSIAPGPTPAQPVFQWQYPAPGTFDSVSIQIFDLDDPIQPGSARLIHNQPNIPLAQQSLVVPAVLSGGGTLQPGVRYSVAIQLDDRRADNSLQARSRAFFDFQLQPAGAPAAFLPTVGPDGVYNFTLVQIAL